MDIESTFRTREHDEGRFSRFLSWLKKPSRHVDLAKSRLSVPSVAAKDRTSGVRARPQVPLNDLGVKALGMSGFSHRGHGLLGGGFPQRVLAIDVGRGEPGEDERLHLLVSPLGCIILSCESTPVPFSLFGPK